MNKNLLMFLLLASLVFQSAYPQEEGVKGSSSKIKATLSDKGKILIKDFYSLGTIKCLPSGTMEISALVLYEPGKEAERQRGVKITINSGDAEKRSNSIYIDNDELNYFNGVVVYMIQVSTLWKGTNRDSSETTFTTKDNLRLGFFQRTMEQVGFAECPGGKLTVYFDVEDLKTIKRILDNAKTILTAK